MLCLVILGYDRTVLVRSDYFMLGQVMSDYILLGQVMSSLVWLYQFKSG